MSLFSFFYRHIARTVVRTTHRGEWFFATHAPKNITTTISNYLDAYRMHLDTHYPLETCIWLYGEYDAMMMHFLRTFLRPDMVFVDVGANCGAFSIAAIRIMQEQGHVYAFEPGPPLLTRLHDNLALNPSLTSLITVVPLGLGKKPGTFFYQEASDIPGNASLLHATGTPVDVIPFDDWATQNHLTRLDAIKIDVEGMEFDVLLGMRAMLTRFHPVIFFESLPHLHTKPGTTLRETYTYLRELGYTLVSGADHTTPIALGGPYPQNTLAIFEATLQ